MKEYICGIVVKERSADKALAQVQEAPLLIDKVLVSDTINCIPRNSIDGHYLFAVFFISSIFFMLLGVGLRNLIYLSIVQEYKNK
jgi:hypothetical protein